MAPTVPLETQLSLTDAIFPRNKPSSPCSQYSPSTGLCTGMCKVLLRRWMVVMRAEGGGEGGLYLPSIALSQQLWKRERRTLSFKFLASVLSF